MGYLGFEALVIHARSKSTNILNPVSYAIKGADDSLNLKALGSILFVTIQLSPEIRYFCVKK